MLRQGRSFSGLERNCIFLNTNGSAESGGRFANISAVSGADFPDDGRALAHVDWDHDGDLDMWISNRNAPRLRFLRNDANLNIDAKSTNRFLQIGLTGNGSDTNRNAIGARVTVHLKENTSGASTAPTTMMQTMYAGDGFLSQGTRWIHFGLGVDAEIDKVEVRWPNEELTVEAFSNIDVDSRFELVQGTGKATELDWRREGLAVKPSPVEADPVVTKTRIPMVSSLPVPPLTYQSFDGKPNVVLKNGKEAVLVNIWSTTCAPCLKELKEFALRQDELKKAGVRVMAVSIDSLGPLIENPVAISKATAERLGLPFDVGMADPKLIDQLRRLHNHAIMLEKPLPLPTSFLIDADGNLAFIYKGTVEVDTLLTDAKLSKSGFVERFERSAAFPGRTIDDVALMAPLTLDASIINLKIGRELIKENKVDEAMSLFADALRLSPESPSAHNDFGVALRIKGRVEDSVKHLRKAVELDPAPPQYRLNLAKVLIKTNQLSEARKLLEEVVARLSGHSDAHFQLGIVKFRQNELAGAQESYEAAIASNPKHGQAHFTLGVLHFAKKEYAQARGHFNKALELDPNQPVVLVNLAKVAIQEKLLIQAENYCLKAIEEQPNYADAHFVLGTIRQEQGRAREATKSYQTALQYDRNHIGARRALQ